jgi:hypothetical protein
MRIRDSGMPDEAYWESLFDAPLILKKVGIACGSGHHGAQRTFSSK